MAALGSTLVTLADVAKSKDKQIGKVAEVLVRQNPMLNDIPYMEMNEGTIHKEDIRSALPSVYYRKANQPIPASKTTTEERTFTAAHFESKSLMDEAVASRGGADRIAYNRWNQAQGHLQAMAIEHAALTVYGSPIDSNRKVAGLMDVYSTLNTSEEASKQILDGGGSTSDMCSILLVVWGERSIFGVYPKGTQAGLKRIDRSRGGPVQIAGTDQNGAAGHFYGFEENFEIDHGLVVKDFRQGVRVANIDPLTLKSGIAATDLIDMMISATHKIESLEAGTPVFYMNRTLLAFLDKQSRTSVGAGGGLSYMDYQGKQILSFRDIPIRRSDAMLSTEDQVTT